MALEVQTWVHLQLGIHCGVTLIGPSYCHGPPWNLTMGIRAAASQTSWGLTDMVPVSAGHIALHWWWQLLINYLFVLKCLNCFCCKWELAEEGSLIVELPCIVCLAFFLVFSGLLTIIIIDLLLWGLGIAVHTSSEGVCWVRSIPSKNCGHQTQCCLSISAVFILPLTLWWQYWLSWFMMSTWIHEIPPIPPFSLGPCFVLTALHNCRYYLQHLYFPLTSCSKNNQTKLLKIGFIHF